MSGEISYQQIFSNISGVPIDYRDIDFLTNDFFSVCDKELFKREYQSFQKATEVDQRSTVRYIPLSTTDKSQYFVLKGEKKERLIVSLTLQTKRDILDENRVSCTADDERFVYQAMDYLLEFSKWIYDIETTFLKIYTTAIEKRQKLGSFYKTAWLGYYYILFNPNIRNMLFKSDGSFQDGITESIFSSVENVFKQISNNIPNKLADMSTQYVEATSRFTYSKQIGLLKNPKIPIIVLEQYKPLAIQIIEDSQTTNEEAKKIFDEYKAIFLLFNKDPETATQKTKENINKLLKVDSH